MRYNNRYTPDEVERFSKDIQIALQELRQKKQVQECFVVQIEAAKANEEMWNEVISSLESGWHPGMRYKIGAPYFDAEQRRIYMEERCRSCDVWYVLPWLVEAKRQIREIEAGGYSIKWKSVGDYCLDCEALDSLSEEELGRLEEVRRLFGRLPRSKAEQKTLCKIRGIEITAGPFLG